MRELEEQGVELQLSLQETERELADAEQDTQSLHKWINDLRELKEAIVKRNAVETRLQLRFHLQKLIEKIEIFAHGYQTEVDVDTKPDRPSSRRNGNRLEYVPTPPQMQDDFYESMEAKVSEFDPDLWSDGQFQEFIKHVAAERRTRKGRFIRVHFKTGSMVDLVPDGSLAFGVELRQESN